MFTCDRRHLFITILKVSGGMVSPFLEEMPGPLLSLHSKLSTLSDQVLEKEENRNQRTYEAATAKYSKAARAKRAQPGVDARKVVVGNPETQPVKQQQQPSHTPQHQSNSRKDQQESHMVGHLCMACGSTEVDNNGDMCDGCDGLDMDLECGGDTSCFSNKPQQSAHKPMRHPEPQLGNQQQPVAQIGNYLCVVCHSRAVNNNHDVCDSCNSVDDDLEYTDAAVNTTSNYQQYKTPIQHSIPQNSVSRHSVPQHIKHLCMACGSSAVDNDGDVCNGCNGIDTDLEHGNRGNISSIKRPQPVPQTRKYLCVVCNSAAVNHDNDVCDCCNGIDTGFEFGSAQFDFTNAPLGNTNNNHLQGSNQRQHIHKCVACCTAVVSAAKELCSGCKEGLDAEPEFAFSQAKSNQSHLCSGCSFATVGKNGDFCDSCSALELNGEPETSNKIKHFRCLMCGLVKALKKSSLCHDCMSDAGNFDDCANIELSRKTNSLNTSLQLGSRHLQTPRKEDVVDLISQPSSPVLHSGNLLSPMEVSQQPVAQPAAKPFEFWKPQMLMFSGRKRKK